VEIERIGEMDGCPDCTDGKEEGPRCLTHEKEYVMFEIHCGLNRLEKIFKEEMEMGRKQEERNKRK